MLTTIIVGFISFLVGVVFSVAVKAWFGKQEASLHAKLDKVLQKVDPNSTQPPAK